MQFNLFDIPAHNKTRTSYDAALEIKPSIGRLHQMILEFLKKRGRFGATNEEIALALGLKIQTVCPRKKELEEKGLITLTGKTRKTKSGRKANVFKLQEDD